MKRISLPENTEEIPPGFFCYSGLEEIVIPRNVKKIVDGGILYGAFCSCENLRSVTFEKGSDLTEIGNNAFYECWSLKSIRLPNKLREIGGLAFWKTSLTEVQIPASVQVIGKDAF